MIEELIVNYGYFAVFLGTALEGEIVLLVAGLAAYLGYLNIGWVLFAGFIGSLVGDQVFFVLGRRRGKDFLARRPNLQKKAIKVQALLEKHRYWLMLGFRFFYGFRILTPLAIGTSNIPSRQFLIFNTIGAMIWSLIFGLGGFVFGNTLEIFIRGFRNYEFKLFLGIIILITLTSLVFWLKGLLNKFLKS